MVSWGILWAILPITFGYLFRHGKWLFLIAGNNTAKKPYNKESLLAGRVAGIIMYAAAVLVILVGIPNIPTAYYYVFAVLFIAFLAGAIVYLNKQLIKMRK
ncbi:DUF3784 domain-containing protein [Lentilactobacillus hilgardii]|uniref:DUF3784 domain-containing protein n=1 Tax=Lentilactobacillus hilgardii TaxID=1588 RepID=UPI003FA57BDD